jgi:hypothetical protein
VSKVPQMLWGLRPGAAKMQQKEMQGKHTEKSGQVHSKLFTQD